MRHRPRACATLRSRVGLRQCARCRSVRPVRRVGRRLGTWDGGMRGGGGGEWQAVIPACVHACTRTHADACTHKRPLQPMQCHARIATECCGDVSTPQRQVDDALLCHRWRVRYTKQNCNSVDIFDLRKVQRSLAAVLALPTTALQVHPVNGRNEACISVDIPAHA